MRSSTFSNMQQHNQQLNPNPATQAETNKNWLGKLLGSCCPEALHHSITFTISLVFSSPSLIPNMGNRNFWDKWDNTAMSHLSKKIRFPIFGMSDGDEKTKLMVKVMLWCKASWQQEPSNLPKQKLKKKWFFS